jgi:predicted nucleic acid-binding protein
LIFVDSSFLIAGIDERDPRHEVALDLLDKVVGSPMVTTNHVRGETWTWLRRKRWHGLAVELLDGLAEKEGHIGVRRVSEQLEDEALHWLRRHDERVYSFVDATSFAYMRARRITDVLAFDGDFAAAGFNELRP